MASSYVVVSSYPTVKVMSPAQVLDVQWISFLTLPTGIGCEYGVPHDAFVLEGSGAADQPIIDALAQAIEQAAQGNGVVGGSFLQDTDPATALLIDFVQYDLVYVPPTAGRGPFATYVNVPVNSFITSQTGIGGLVINTAQYPAPSTVVGDAYASLVAMAGG